MGGSECTATLHDIPAGFYKTVLTQQLCVCGCVFVCVCVCVLCVRARPLDAGQVGVQNKYCGTCKELFPGHPNTQALTLSSWH